MKYWIGIIVLLTLAGCASGGAGQPKASSFAFLNSYQEAQKQYERGEIMLARAKIMAMEKDREDYAQAQKLLKNKIEPARLRLLRHYKNKARKAEKNKDWAKAESLYAQTAEFSSKPEIFLQKAVRMNLNMRQVRLDQLLKQRRSEDKQMLIWAKRYSVPRGVDKRDESFKRMQEHVQEEIESRSRRALREGWRYLKRDMVGVAYVEAESALRLDMDAYRGQVLMKDIKKNWPKGLKIRAMSKKGKKKSTKRSVQRVDMKQVQALIKQGKWLQARTLVLTYRRQGGKDAQKLQEKIHIGASKQAAVRFHEGMKAFRQENISKAVQLWDEAVNLAPDNDEYVDALRRAMQLQERLQLLRSEKGK